MSGGRRFAPTLTCRSVRREDGLLELRAPGPGLYRDPPAPGSLLSPGAEAGTLEVLGVLHPLRVPDGARGLVTAEGGPRLGRRPVDGASALCLLDPEAVLGADDGAEEDGAGSTAGGFRTPLGGRYYRRPAPDAPPFVEAGQVLTGGETVALIEVMKTFNRITFDPDAVEGDGPHRIVRIVPADGDDVEEGDLLLELA